EDGGWHYFVMEYATGGDLHQAVLKGRVKRDEIITIILRAGDALGEAHSKGIVHRDIKPANILLDDTNMPKVTDFDLVGINNMTETGGTHTGAMGTFLFSAPECLHKPQLADSAADVFSLAMCAIFGLYGSDLPVDVLRNADEFIEPLPCSYSAKE